MKSEGEQLRLFIDNQPKSKISIAKELGMSKQNLFGLFKSRLLEDETKSRFERYFGQSIFSQDQSSMVEEKEVQFAPLTRSSLEKSIENLTENELRTTAVIERLVGLLERSMSSVPPGKEPLVQTPADTQGGGQRVVQDLALDKRYSKQKK